MNRFLKIGVMVATCVAAGYFAGLATQSGVNDWYPTLEKPVFNPPSWLFAPVWSLLYILMGIAAGRVWGRIDFEPEPVRKALWLFAAQLALNILWSFLFFWLHNTLLALIEIVLLALLIYETIMAFKRVDKLAAYFMVPYLVWVSFATLLNGSIWWLNR